MRISRRAGLAALAGVALVVVLVWQGWTRLTPPPHHPTNTNASASGAATPGKSAAAADDDDQSDDTSPTPTAPAQSWVVDKTASRLTFRGVMDGAPFDGVFRSWSARIAFDPSNLKGSKATITIDADSP